MVLCLVAELNLLPAMLLGERDASSRPAEDLLPHGETGEPAPEESG
jgi:hypothetical protein